VLIPSGLDYSEQQYTNERACAIAVRVSFELVLYLQPFPPHTPSILPISGCQTGEFISFYSIPILNQVKSYLSTSILGGATALFRRRLFLPGVPQLLRCGHRSSSSDDKSRLSSSLSGDRRGRLGRRLTHWLGRLLCGGGGGGGLFLRRRSGFLLVVVFGRIFGREREVFVERRVEVLHSAGGREVGFLSLQRLTILRDRFLSESDRHSY
jgi:hypothetical protein